MKKLLLVALPLLIIGISFAPHRALASDQFGFYCKPYIQSFEDGKHYAPIQKTATTTSVCTFELPSSLVGHQIGVGLFKGTLGEAQYLGGVGNLSINSADQTYQTTSLSFAGDGPTPQQDDDFFAVVYDDGSWDGLSNPTYDQFQNFFTAGGTPPNDRYYVIKWKWGLKPPTEYNPVIIIPGILGSWQNLLGAWVLDPMSHIYDNLIATLEANGYVENKTLFKFPYDWEKSNVETARLLAQKITDIKKTCGCKYVDIVAHSMGGLVATQYIESDDYKNDVDQLITLGTPIAGSPQAYRTWEAGQVDVKDVPSNFILSRIFAREAADNGYSSVVNYIQNKPVASVQELLPISNYLKQGSAFLEYPTGYPQNTFLENLIGDSSKYQEDVYNKVRVTVVTGDAGPTSTVLGYTVQPTTQAPLWKDGEPVATSTGKGDDTVPFDNATYFSGPDFVAKGSHHADLASSSEEYVFTKLTGLNPTKLINVVQPPYNKDWAILIEKTFPSASDFSNFLQMVKNAYNKEIGSHVMLFLTLFSPIDVKVTAPNGSQIGKDFSTGQMINQIPNSIYSGPIGEHEYIVIEDPLPGQYKVETIGTGNGAYTVATGLVTQATTTTSLVTGATETNQIISNSLFISSTSTSLTLTPPLPPVATSTPTTTSLTPDTCVTDITKAYKDKWIGKKGVADNLVLDCKALKPLLAAKGSAKTTLAKNLTTAAIKLVLADMDLLAKDKGNTKDGVSLISKYTTWFRSQNS